MASFISPTFRVLPSIGTNSASLPQGPTNHPSNRVSPTPLPNPTQAYLLHTIRATPPAPAISTPQPVVIWFRQDLRLHDHPALHAAVSNAHPIAALLFVPAKPTRFWCDAARDLRNELRSRGAELHVRSIFRSVPEEVLAFTEEVSARALYFHVGVTRDAQNEETLIENQLSKRDVKVERFWTGALHAPQQLPFEVDNMPEDCDLFEELTRGVAVDKPLPIPDNIIGVYGIEAGDIPMGDGVGGGGERVGLARVRDYVNSKSLVEMNGGSIGVIDTKFGRLGQFLNIGCVSPRRLWHDVMEKVSEENLRRWCAKFELTLRNFVVFMTLKKGVFPA